MPALSCARCPWPLGVPLTRVHVDSEALPSGARTPRRTRPHRLGEGHPLILTRLPGSLRIGPQRSITEEYTKPVEPDWITNDCSWPRSRPRPQFRTGVLPHRPVCRNTAPMAERPQGPTHVQDRPPVLLPRVRADRMAERQPRRGQRCGQRRTPRTGHVIIHHHPWAGDPARERVV